MITDEEIDTVFETTTDDYLAPTAAIIGLDLYGFARAIYQLGRQHQRESDAALCKHLRGYSADYCAEAIRANTGELK